MGNNKVSRKERVEYISFEETQDQEYISFPETQKGEYDRFDRILQDPHAKPEPLTLNFLKYITNGFSKERELGNGGFGVVYKGILRNGKEIAVKKLYIRETNLGDEQYQKELENLFGLEHKNIVQFKGYCAYSSLVPWPLESQSQGRDQCVLAELRERVLCFEYVSNKSLREQISDASCGLEWLVRYEIIKGICSGLHYLHTERDIAHMDLKPENILLDDNMVPKIADFGTSRFFRENESRIITRKCVGSWGYMAPEYVTRGIISKKADIFSFGVIILELLTGSKSEYPQSTEDVVRKWSKRLPNELYSQQVRRCISIASNCVDTIPDRRPTTGDIIEKLNEVEDPKAPKVDIGDGTITLIAIGAALALIFYLKNQCSSRPRVILFTIGATLAAVLALNPSSNLFTIGSWAVTTLKFVIIAGVTLLAIGVAVVGRRHDATDILAMLFIVLGGVHVLFSQDAKSKDHPKQDEQERKNEATSMKSSEKSSNGA